MVKKVNTFMLLTFVINDMIISCHLDSRQNIEKWEYLFGVLLALFSSLSLETVMNNSELSVKDNQEILVREIQSGTISITLYYPY